METPFSGKEMSNIRSQGNTPENASFEPQSGSQSGPQSGIERTLQQSRGDDAWDTMPAAASCTSTDHMGRLLMQRINVRYTGTDMLAAVLKKGGPNGPYMGSWLEELTARSGLRYASP
jgi:hypothetical protein